MSAIKHILKFFFYLIWSRRLGEEQDQMDKEFDLAVVQAKERKSELEKLEIAKSKLAEFEHKHPEEKNEIDRIRALIQEKEQWLGKDVINKLNQIEGD